MKIKIVTVIFSALLLSGCSFGPQRPNAMAMTDAIMNHGMKADQVNQIYADYDKARAEYEQSTGYKVLTGTLMGVAAIGAVAPRGYSGGGVINTKTTSNGHGSYSTTYSVWGY
jgi:hypothetical protein